MEPLPSYNLLQAIDPTKIKVPISDRFAKLTLSSNKKKQQQNDPEKFKELQRQQEKRDSISRDISKQFEEENRDNARKSLINPLLRSESSKETTCNNSVDMEEEDLTMDALQVTQDYDNPTQMVNEVDLLSQQIASMVVESRPISLSSGSTDDLSIKTGTLTSESQRSSLSNVELIHIVHNIPINVKEAANRDTIALNLSSSSNIHDLEEENQLTEEDQKIKEENVNISLEEYDEEDDEEDAITISDSLESHHEEEHDIMATSSLPSISLTADSLVLPTLPDNKAERVAAFLEDVSIERRFMEEQGQLDFNDTVDQIIKTKEIDRIQESLAKSKELAAADTESMTPDVDEEVTPTSLIERERRLKALEESMEKENPNKSDILKESEEDISNDSKDHELKLLNDETQDNTIMSIPEQDNDKEKTSKILIKLKTPITNINDNIYRMANDETQCNTEFSLSEEDNNQTPKPIKTQQNENKPHRIETMETEPNTEFSLTEDELTPQKNKISDPHKLQNDETLANSIMTDINYNKPNESLVYNYTNDYKTPEKTAQTMTNNDTRNNSSISIHSTPQSSKNSQYKEDSLASVIYSSPESKHNTPEVSLTISETDDESIQEKSPNKDENSEDKKLSNSFHKEESSDDSDYQEQISKIQMSMASINISAKINIKIHIPNTTSTETSEDEQLDNDNNREENINNKGSPQLQDVASANNQSVNSTDQSILSESPEKPCKQQQVKSVPAQIEFANSSSDSKALSDNSIDSNDQSMASVLPEKTCRQQQLKTTHAKILESPNSSPDSVEIVEDKKFLTEAEKLLTQLYGKSWQTPDVIRTLKRESQSGDKKSGNSKTSSRKMNGPKSSQEKKSDNKSKVEESILDDFSIFRRNIVKTNLDSTRLATPKTGIQNKEVFTEPRNRKPPTLKENRNPIAKPQSERKPMRPPVAKVVINKGRVKDDKWRQLLDDDSNSEGDNASDDDDADQSWSKNASEIEKDMTDDSDFETPKPRAKNTNRNTTKGRQQQGRSNKSDILTKKLNRSKVDEIVYLDLSKEEVEVLEEVPESPPANHDVTFASRLQDILKTCQPEVKAKLPSSSQKSKRKLFTPNFGDDELETAPFETEEKTKEKNKITYDDELLDDSGACPFDSQGRPKILDVVNKKLESVKTGKPIFQLTPSPKKKETPSSTKNNKNDKTNKATPKATKPDEAVFKTPTSVKSKGPARALQELCQTPDYKYSFLKSLDVTVSKVFCHPDALYYRDNYRTKKEDLSKILYDMYNEKLFQNKLNCPITWNKKLSNTAGRCLNKKRMGLRTSSIELSDKVLTSADRLRCTLIHELCHAATWIFNGEGGHGSTWKEWARRANATFPEIPKIGVCHQYEIEYKYTYKCTLCAAKSYTHSKSKKVENIRCSYCHGAIEIFLNKKDKDGNIMPTPVREPTGFAKFVKDNYKKFKRDDLKHADVMKLLSSEFATLKVASN